MAQNRSHPSQRRHLAAFLLPQAHHMLGVRKPLATGQQRAF
jgi:hypothetical protein